MNDVELTPEHGFPLRAIVPGWYAMASVKWLQRIIVTDRPFNGYYQTLDYAFWKRRGDGAELTPLSEMQVKAEIARPVQGETVPANSSVRDSRRGLDQRCRNYQGRGQHGRGIDMERQRSCSANRSQTRGGFGNSIGKRLLTAGKTTLIARATDSHGRTQPVERDPDRGTYMINHLLPIRWKCGKILFRGAQAASLFFRQLAEKPLNVRCEESCRRGLSSAGCRRLQAGSLCSQSQFRCANLLNFAPLRVNSSDVARF